MARKITNIAASVRARLLQISRDKKQNFQNVLVRYSIERLLFRLTQSRYADRFILKGAMLVMTWFDEPIRVTRDLDLLGYGDPDPEQIRGIFLEILRMDEPDGIQFDVDGVDVSFIKTRDLFTGIRVQIKADIDKARVPINIDIGFGDATVPQPELVDYPVLLDMPAPRLHGYVRETVVAEKFHAMVSHGTSNSRMKDYFDIWILSKSFDFDKSRLADAISATFATQNTEVPSDVPASLTQDFAKLPIKQKQWDSFKKKLYSDPGSFHDIVGIVRDFIMPSVMISQQRQDRNTSP